jgi:hypothetical protein
MKQICQLIFDQIEDVIKHNNVIEHYGANYFSTIPLLENEIGRAETILDEVEVEEQYSEDIVNMSEA